MEAIVSANPDRRFGAIAFAKRAVVTDLVGAPHLALTTEVPLGEATDLDAAVVLALASLPERGTEQFVLVSDGRITDGLTEALARWSAQGSPSPPSRLGKSRRMTPPSFRSSFP